MSARSYLGGILHMFLAAMVTRELDIQEVPDSPQSPETYPVFLPVSYEVNGADFFLLKEMGQDIMRNSSMQSHTQSMVILRVERPPVVMANYSLLFTQTEVQLDLLQSVSLFSPSQSIFTFNWKVHFFVLTRQVHSSNPKVRVLFYIPGHEFNRIRMDEWSLDRLPCVVVYVYSFWQTQEVRGSCVISGKSGLCVADVNPRTEWFGPAQGNQLELYYQTKPALSSSCREQELPPVNYDPITPLQRIGSVRLLQVKPGTTPVLILKLGDTVVIQTSSKVLQKNDVTSFLVYVKTMADLDYFSLSAVVGTSLSFNKATPTNVSLWDVTVETVSKEQVRVIFKKQSSTSGKRLSKLQVVLQLDIQVDEVRSLSEVQEIKWELVPSDDDQMQRTTFEGSVKIYTTQRDFVGLAPLIMDTELMNTAVLTGKQVMVPVRVVVVEADGSVTDVTNFTDCNSTDEDVLKVSDRCDYVYVNGKETKGRVGMEVNFTYIYMSTQLEITVWFPRIPLDIEVSDSELSPIKGWRIPINSKRSSRITWSSEEEKRGRGCTLQFQHALLRVLTHFIAEQSDPREPQAYFLGSDWLVDVTKMVQYFIKVEDPGIIRLQDGWVLSGQDVGSTYIKVLSPLSDSILAEKLVSVVDDRVSITELGLQLVSGLTLHLQLNTGSNRAISVTATTQEVLNLPKQKAVLSSWLQFSDGSMTPLEIYDSTQYLLNLTSLDEAVVLVRDSPLAVVAEGEGQGSLVRVEMTICEACQKTNRKSVLAVGSINVKVKFRNSRSSGNKSLESATIANSEKKTDYSLEDEEEIKKPAGDGKVEREESALRKATTTMSTSQDAAVRSITNDLGSGTNNEALTGLNQLGNILDMDGFLNPFRPSKNGSTEDLDRISEDTTGNFPGHLMNYNNSPVQVEIPIQEPESNADDDLISEGPLTNRPLTHLEIGMYALLAVFCLAILVFLANCILHFFKFNRKHTPFQVPEQTGHDWMWLRTDTQELILNSTHRTSGNGIGPKVKPCGTPVQKTDYQVASVATNPDFGSVMVETERSESPHSPTSKRKRVQFTTFALMDCQSLTGTIPRKNGCGIQWVGKENFVTPDVPDTESLEQL